MSVTHFQCDSCDQIYGIDEANVCQCRMTLHNSKSEGELRYYLSHVQICRKCFECNSYGEVLGDKEES